MGVQRDKYIDKYIDRCIFQDLEIARIVKI